MPSTSFDPFDPTELALSSDQLASISITKARLTPRRKAKPFIMRVPYDWACQAARLPGRCAAVGEILWFLAGRARSRAVLFCLARGRDMGLSKKATRAAIRHLATAGLVSIVRKPGRGLEVTLLDATTEKET
jgi:hypothetical protein